MSAESRGMVLVIDDNEAGRYALARRLREAGFLVTEGETGRDALRLVARHPDALVLDLKLPDVNGFEVCRRIKADPVTARTPILHISAEFVGPQDGERALESGADAYLRQPADPEVLVATIHALVRARHVREEYERLAQNENLTLRRQFMQALSLSEQRFRVGLKGTPISVWEQDRNLRYTWVYNLLPGWEKTDPVGSTDADLVHAQDLPRLTALKRRVLDTGVPAREEISMTVNGDLRIYDFTVEPLRDSSGAIVGLTGTALDATETKRLEARLLEARKMESIGLLAGGVAHDFNNLLTGILGNASIALDSLEPGHPCRPQLDSVIEAGERAAELVSRLLAFAGKGRFVLEVLDMSRFVTDNLGLLRASIPAALELRASLAADLPMIRGDLLQLRRLLTSLVANAAEAIGQGKEGTVRIETGVQHVDDLPETAAPGERMGPGEYVFLDVSDSGCGMDEATRLRAFDPFFTTKFAGRGLGLSAARGIVAGHRGAIQIYSVPGAGTRFRALFPVAAEGAPRQAATVLVADADQFIREMTRAVLERHGYAVLLAADVPEAVAKFESNTDAISAVVLDASIPEAGGADLLEYIRGIRPHLGVVVTSGRSAQDVMRQFPSDSALMFVQKPYTSRQIAEIVKTASRISLVAGAC